MKAGVAAYLAEELRKQKADTQVVASNVDTEVFRFA